MGLSRAARGFTLIEVLVSLAIIALAVAMLVPSLAGPTSRARLDAAARDVAFSLRLTRARAIEAGRPALFLADIGQGTYRPADEPPRRLPRGIRLALYTTTDLISTPTLGAIRFLADGSSSGGGINVFDDQGEGFRILIEWATGDVTRTRLERLAGGGNGREGVSAWRGG